RLRIELHAVVQHHAVALVRQHQFGGGEGHAHQRRYQRIVGQAAGSNLGLLKQGTYVVVGRPEGDSRAFWDKSLVYNTRTNQV
ncbi:hypothetical protein L7A49_33095, partial [Achromobacter xylosoxidans]|nr:hypothetical protein [Achromobacter xylosoxidans]